MAGGRRSEIKGEPPSRRRSTSRSRPPDVPRPAARTLTDCPNTSPVPSFAHDRRHLEHPMGPRRRRPVDLKRIVDTARQMGDFDGPCLQEVADNYPGLAGAGTDNEFALLAALLPRFRPTEGVSVSGYHGPARQRFGNMILSRRRRRRCCAISCRGRRTWPSRACRAWRWRLCSICDGPRACVTTHLEYYAAGQRAAQVEALRALQVEAAGHASNARSTNQAGRPFEPRARDGHDCHPVRRFQLRRVGPADRPIAGTIG